MKGSNHLLLNEATMMEAIQFWLDSQMIHQAPKVTGVQATNTGNYATFEIRLDADADRSDPRSEGKQP